MDTRSLVNLIMRAHHCDPEFTHFELVQKRLSRYELESIAENIAHNPYITHFTMNGCQLDKETLELIVVGLCHLPNLTHLDFAGNKLDDQAVLVLLRKIREWPHLSHVNLSNNRITGNGFKLVHQMINLSKCLSSINIKNNMQEDINTDAFLRHTILSKKIKHYGLSWYKVSTTTAHVINTLLKQHPITGLDFEWTTYSRFNYFCRFLPKSAQLKYLDLSYCNLKPIETGLLLEAIPECTVLERLNLSHNANIGNTVMTFLPDLKTRALSLKGVDISYTNLTTRALYDSLPTFRKCFWFTEFVIQESADALFNCFAQDVNLICKRNKIINDLLPIVIKQFTNLLELSKRDYAWQADNDLTRAHEIVYPVMQQLSILGEHGHPAYDNITGKIAKIILNIPIDCITEDYFPLLIDLRPIYECHPVSTKMLEKLIGHDDPINDPIIVRELLKQEPDPKTLVMNIFKEKYFQIVKAHERRDVSRVNETPEVQAPQTRPDSPAMKIV